MLSLMLVIVETRFDDIMHVQHGMAVDEDRF